MTRLTQIVIATTMALTGLFMSLMSAHALPLRPVRAEDPVVSLVRKVEFSSYYRFQVDGRRGYHPFVFDYGTLGRPGRDAVALSIDIAGVHIGCAPAARDPSATHCEGHALAVTPASE